MTLIAPIARAGVVLPFAIARKYPGAATKDPRLERLVDLGMAAKVRPALVVIIPANDLDGALVTLVPHTTSPRESRFDVSVTA